MKLFISWSGERSHQIAKKLESWIPKLFPGVEIEIFVSSELEKGTSWFPQIVSELEDSEVGIICLTPENLNSTWLHFEAGALAKSVSPPTNLPGADSNVEHRPARLYTYLHQVKPGQLTGPLAAYQSTTSVREDTERLVASLAGNIARDPNKEIDWPENFKKFWPELELALRTIRIPIQELIPEFEGLFQRKTFNEPLHHCTAQTWADRYDGVRQTYEKLSARLEMVVDACPRYQADLCQKLLAQLDGYSMNVKALLLKAPPFELNDNGALNIPAGILTACEDRRLEIKDILSSMLDPLNVPKVDDAVRFTECERFAQRKVLVHRQEKEIRRHQQRLFDQGKEVRGPYAIQGLVDPTRLPEYLASSWDLDRIYYYLIEECLELASQSSLGRAFDFVVMEMETLRSKTEKPSMMPLHYSLGALCALIPNQMVEEELARRVETVLQDVESYIQEPDNAERDKGGQVRRTIAEIRNRMERNASTSPAAAEDESQKPELSFGTTP